MICKKCGLDKDTSEYLVYTIKEKEYIRRECTPCFKKGRRQYYMNNPERFKQAKLRSNLKKGLVKKRVPKPVYLTDEDINIFINKLKRQAGYADVIDIYRLIHIYTIIFGVKYYDHLSIEDQLILMWSELKEYRMVKNDIPELIYTEDEG
jgi:integrase